MNQPAKIGSDNELEDYFLGLLVDKHIIDREIQVFHEHVRAITYGEVLNVNRVWACRSICWGSHQKPVL